MTHTSRTDIRITHNITERLSNGGALAGYRRVGKNTIPIRGGILDPILAVDSIFETSRQSGREALNKLVWTEFHRAKTILLFSRICALTDDRKLTSCVINAYVKNGKNKENYSR